MTSDEKIKWVKDRVYELEKMSGGFGSTLYPLVPITQDFGTFEDYFASIFDGGEQKQSSEKKTVVVITVNEQINILKRLEKDGLIKITEIKEDDAFLEVFPPHPSPLKLKTLEHISRSLADAFTGSEIVDILMDYGIPRCDIPYPNTKWRTLQEMFLALATSPNPEQRAKFGGALTTFLHPINFNANEEKSQELITSFNKYLKYDGYEITLNEDGDGYQLVQTEQKTKVSEPTISLTEEQKKEAAIAEATPPPSRKVTQPTFAEEQTRQEEMEEEYSNQVEYETKLLRDPKAAEHLAVIRETYKTLMAITSSFCKDPTTPSRELNTAYTALAKIVSDELATFCGDTSEFSVFSFDEYKKNNFGIPFNNLYSAELDFRKNERELHWDEIRPEMNAVLGQIEDLCQTANAPDVISEPDVQKIIGDAMLLLSEIAATRKKEKSDGNKEVLQMEITGIPPIQLKSDTKQKNGFYITKEGDDFLYKGKHLKLSPKADYYRVFSVLYSLIPKGGAVPYKDLIDAVKKSIRKVEDKNDEELRKFIQRNLTDKSNGFLRYASIPEKEDNGKPLLSVIRGSGVVFNNKAG